MLINIPDIKEKNVIIWLLSQSIMELNKKNNEIYYYQIETWHQLDQDLDLSQQLKTNDLIFKILHEVYTINLNHMVILVSSTSICWRLFVNTP